MTAAFVGKEKERCEARRCGAFATQTALYRDPTPPYGRLRKKLYCEVHALEAVASERPPHSMAPLATWSAYLRTLERREQLGAVRRLHRAQVAMELGDV